MGVLCSCARKPQTKNDTDVSDQSSTVERESQVKQAVSSSTTIPVIRSPNEILDDSLKQEINDIIQEKTEPIPANFETERQRIVESMKNAQPDRYLGLNYTDYPDINGNTVNEMAQKFVTSSEIQQEIINEVEQRITSSFQSRTTDWQQYDSDQAYSILKSFIAKQVEEKFKNIQFN